MAENSNESQGRSAFGDGGDGNEKAHKSSRPRIPASESLVEVYRTDNDIVAGLVVDEILRPAGIFATRHERRSKSFVAPASMPGEIGIAVDEAHVEAARNRLLAARKDGVLLDGDFVDEARTT